MISYEVCIGLIILKEENLEIMEHQKLRVIILTFLILMI